MCYNTDTNKNVKPYSPTNQNGKIMCNSGDTLNSTICKNASGVSYAPDLSDPTNPKCSNVSDSLDKSGNPWAICYGTGLFDKVDGTVSSKTFGTVLNKNTGNDKKCTDNMIKTNNRPSGSKGFCVRGPTQDEIENLKNTKWYKNFQDQFASASS